MKKFETLYKKAKSVNAFSGTTDYIEAYESIAPLFAKEILGAGQNSKKVAFAISCGRHTAKQRQTQRNSGQYVVNAKEFLREQYNALLDSVKYINA